MFRIFGDKKAKLEKKYQQLLDEAYRLSHVDRKKSDLKTAEAEEVRKQLEAIDSSQS
ncbi:MAG: Lacal_2735 family protein [bacterium]|nr:Lacal_2735 family protein [bacterium]